MHLVYIDEVKFKEPEQPYHWLCALAFPSDSIQEADLRLSQVAKDHFGTETLTVDTEFHAKHIIHGKGPYKGQDIASRLGLYRKLLDIIDETTGLGRIEIRIEVSKVEVAGYKDLAFMFLVEKVDDYMRQEKSLAPLIADEDQELASSNVVTLSSYRASGTPYAFGRKITRVIDTIHHTKSHHSRLLQLADIYVYTQALTAGTLTNYPHKAVMEYARSKSNLLFPSKYKLWPRSA